MTLISPYEAEQRQALLDLSIRAWTSVFPALEQAVPRFVYESFWPQGWQKRQIADLAKVLDDEPENVDVALVGQRPVGWICTRLHPEDKMAEIYVLAVDPDYQRQGIGKALLARAQDRAMSAGMSMVMVETGDDPGHAPARGMYEANGFQRWPVARYFLNLED
jgi:ribosomal protein S18 acetylase RimI-like enzyme